MAEPIVSFLLETIANLLIKEGKFLAGVSDEAEQLHSELKMMRAFLKDADEKQHQSAIVKEWVSQCRDLAYQAEDVLEIHAFKLASRQRARDTMNVFRRFAHMLNGCVVRHNIGLEIQSLSSRVSNLTRRFQEYGIRAVTEKEGSRQQQPRMTYSYVADDEEFVGLQPDVKKLVQALTSEDDSFGQNQVVSIVGMGGSGKTTLARKAYNHPNVKHHFDNFAWVCISRQWQTRNILQGILVCFFPDRREEIEKRTDDELVKQLGEVQQNVKCLVVLDDIWSIDPWECIKVTFPVRNKGNNKILLTTRNKDVADHVGPNGYHHQMRLLDPAESWELLQKKALFGGRPSQEYGDIHKVEELGKEMIKSCGGLPLAVIVLGGILATKHTFNEWSVVHKNVKTYLGRGESIGQQQGEVQKILSLSYNDLPYKLKPSFLYLSGFYEDVDIGTKQLYHLWIGEGLVYAEDRIGEESMIDVAERYLGELVKRCIVHVKVAENCPSIRKFTLCNLHDLMRDLCLEKAREENFVKVIDHRHGNQDFHELVNSSFPSSGNIYRLMIYLRGDNTQRYALPEIKASKHLRTLVLSAGPFDQFMLYETPPSYYMAQLAESQLNRFKMLRSLIIEGMITPGFENIEVKNSTPDDTFKLSIDDLIHLRYLSLRGSKLVISPSSINNLEHMETLDLSGTKILWTTNVALRMQRLRYLYLNSKNNFSLQIYVSSNLEILKGFDPAEHDVRDFSELNNLQSLYAIMAEGKYVKEIINYISNSQKLRQAIISNISSLEMEPALVRRLFCSNLQYLSFAGIFGKLPKYDSQFFRNLLELQMFGSKLKDDPMQVLEKLPNLQKLSLGYHAFDGKEMVCSSNGFPQLRFLQIEDLPYLETWKVEKGAMLNLSRLEISYCNRLSMIPDGLRFIEPLKELLIVGMPEEFGNRVRVVDEREGEDFDEVRYVISIMFTREGPLYFSSAP